MTNKLCQRSYQIGENMPGSVQFTIHLGVHPQTKTVHGMGQITQAVSPPLSISTALDGEYSVVTPQVRGEPGPTSWISISTTGYLPRKSPFPSGPGPVIPNSVHLPVGPGLVTLPNVHLTMALTNWISGTADFSYRVSEFDTEWHDFKDIPVRLIDINPS